MCSQKKITLYSWMIFAIFACFSCSYKQQEVLFDNKIPIDTAKDKTAATSYKIKPGDLLQIRNLQNRRYIADEPTILTASGNSGREGPITYLVEENGRVTLPIIGPVKVAGINRREAADQIETIYRKELKDPIIELKIVNLKVNLLGEVKSQGTYKLTAEGTSLVDIIGEAGGLTEKANSKKVKIIRGDVLHREVIEFDLSNVSTLTDSRIILQNNDIIYVAQNKQAVRTEKLKNMSAILQPAIALLNTALIIYTFTR